jgi:hypothetical protein
MKLKNVFFVFIVYSVILNIIGCEAVMRKFSRKSKKENLPQTEMVLVPEEYRDTMGKEELYRQYFLFWKSWHDELINSLSIGANHKKQIGSVNEAIKNLEQLKVYLNAEKQKKLDIYLDQLKTLKELITKDVYGSNINTNRWTAENIKRNILRNFTFNKIKNFLK